MFCEVTFIYAAIISKCSICTIPNCRQKSHCDDLASALLKDRKAPIGQISKKLRFLTHWHEKINKCIDREFRSDYIPLDTMIRNSVGIFRISGTNDKLLVESTASQEERISHGRVPRYVAPRHASVKAPYRYIPTFDWKLSYHFMVRIKCPA